MVDPLPGPRAASDFDGLVAVDELNKAFAATTRPIPPAGSTMPRLASELDGMFVLLDPSHGANGLRRQLRSLVRTTGADSIEIVDVGGDVVASGDEPSLMSPLADALALAATDGQDVPVQVRVVGAGLDGELPAPSVHRIIQALSGEPVGRFDEDQALAIMPVLDWHPSEATALTAAAALGLRGKVEIREHGHLVELIDDSPTVFAVPHRRALAQSAPARAVDDSQTLDDAEHAVREVCGRSELDQERRKAANRRRTQRHGLTDKVVNAAHAYCAQAQQRGIGYVTFRRLAEVVGLDANDARELRTRLIAEQPERYRPPLWSVQPAGMPASTL